MKKNFLFNSSSIAGLETGRHSDPVLPGLYVTVSRTGRKVWLFRRRVPQFNRTVKLTCGVFPAKSIGAARLRAAWLNELIERGVNHREEARAEKARAMSEAHIIYLAAMRRGDRKTLKPRTLYDKEVIFPAISNRNWARWCWANSQKISGGTLSMTRRGPQYINGFYSTLRRHSCLDDISPLAFEDKVA